MPNIFLIPNCPIKDLTSQYQGVLLKDNNPAVDPVYPADQCSCVPTFLGFGRTGGLSRFRDFLKGPRDVYKRHPASIGHRKGVNTPEHGVKMMDISAKFVGNFLIKGTCRDGAGSLLTGVTVKLFRSSDDVYLDTEVTDASGVFTFTMPVNSNGNYYITVSNGTASGISSTITAVQV